MLVTGAGGFAGSWLAEACVAEGDEVVAISRAGPEHAVAGAQALAVDLLDAEALRASVQGVRPRVVYHLAALASVSRSWERPEAPLVENPVATLNLLEAVRAHAPQARVIVVGSGEIYGPPASLPVDEDAPLRPQNPYAVSKAAADLLGAMYADAHGLDVVRVRAFNHAGPRQGPEYVVSTLARQVAAGLRAGDEPIRVVTGNPEPRRDFTDVRDVVRAYRLLGRPTEAPAGAYNVCSGTATSVTELVAMLRETSGRDIDHTVDPALVREHDVMEIRGSCARLAGSTGWRPEIPLARTLRDAVEWWTERLAREAG